MGGVWDSVPSSPGSIAAGHLANLAVPIPPHTWDLVRAIEAIDPPCSSGNRAQDALCRGFNMATGNSVGLLAGATVPGRLASEGVHAVAGTAVGAISNLAQYIKAVEIGADAGVPGYAYDAVTIAGRRVTLYADATRVPGGDRRRSFPRWTGRSRWFSSARTTDRYWMLRRRGLLTTPRARCIPTWATRRGLTQPTPPRVRGAT
jgi:hypothetical protein